MCTSNFLVGVGENDKITFSDNFTASQNPSNSLTQSEFLAE
jgi:hypothetical protein